ncbi:hypothetical protein GCM10027347_52760 [Larkinella harenae]
MVAHHIQRQTDRLYFEIQRLQIKVAGGERLDAYNDFETLIGIRNSLVFLKDLVAENDFEPADCDIAVSDSGNLCPVAKSNK